jgi:hypothetical protein
MNNDYVVEVVLMRPRADVTDAELTAALDATAADIASLPGFVKREVLRDEKGQWIDIVYWRSMADAQQALALVGDKPEVQRMFTLLDESEAQMFHFSPVLQTA